MSGESKENPPPMHLVQRMLSHESEFPRTRQVVPHAERRQFLKRRWRGKAEDGTEFGFDLEERLVDGAVIHRCGDKDYIVRQLPETVYRIPLHGIGQAAVIAWMTGNLHMPAQIVDGALLVLHDEAMGKLIEREGWEFSEAEVLFQPMKAVAHN